MPQLAKLLHFSKNFEERLAEVLQEKERLDEIEAHMEQLSLPFEEIKKNMGIKVNNDVVEPKVKPITNTKTIKCFLKSIIQSLDNKIIN